MKHTKVVEIEVENFAELVLNSERKCVVIFWENESRECENMKTLCEILSCDSRYTEILFCSLKLDNLGQNIILSRQGIRKVPTIVFYKGGKEFLNSNAEKTRKEGFCGRMDLETVLQELLEK